MNITEILKLHRAWLNAEPGGVRANLRDANLIGANLRSADLRDANLRDANLRDANLIGANLRSADLRDANLRDANLRDANLIGANLRDVPVVADLDRTILDIVEKDPNALDMDGWHTCETTHCMAGWAITLAGVAGTVLEERLGPAAAGALIYHVSAGVVPNFYASNEKALSDLRARVAAHSAKS